MKNSYMETVKEMIHEIRIECPACGADQKSQIKESSNIFGINSKNNSQFISKILKHEAHSRISSEHNRDSYQIVVNSPLLSPFFPSKVQRR
jgi:soluble P-type ATPase